MNHDHDTLESLRKSLQETDLQLLLLLQERFTLIERMGVVKSRFNIAPLQEDEWRKKVDFLSSHLEVNKQTKELLEVFYFIHNISVEIQERIRN